MSKFTLLMTTALAVGLSGAAFAQETHPETGETLAEDQTFSYRLLDQFPTIDPQLIEETAGGHVARQIFEGLLTQDDQGELRPGVATEWTSEDNQTWTFTLRQDAMWSNGDPVTAQDFVYAWRRAADPATIITPGKVYRALGKKADCGGCLPLFMQAMLEAPGMEVPANLRGLRRVDMERNQA